MPHQRARNKLRYGGGGPGGRRGELLFGEDLNREEIASAAREAERILSGVEGIKFIHFTERDVVRHALVQKIITAYERDDRARESAGESANGVPARAGKRD